MARDDISETIRAVQPLTYASVCSGIEAASVAWEPLGWKCLWLAETDKAASAVLRHLYPDVPNLGDLVTLADRMLAGEMEPPDVVIGGTPCQSFSVAGLRAGLADPRGWLTMNFILLVDAIDVRRRALGLPPVTIVWENVPGALTHKDNPFGCFLGALVGEDLPLIPSGRKWTHAGLVSGPERTAAWRILDAQYFGLAQRRNRLFVVASADFGTDPGAILFESQGVRRDSPPRRETGEEIAGTIDARTDGGGFPGTDFASAGGVQPAPQWWDGRPVAQTLDAVLAKGQTMPEKDRFPAVLQPVAFSSKDHGSDATTDLAPTPEASGHTDSHANAGAPPAVIYVDPVSPTLRAASDRPASHNKVNGTDRTAMVAYAFKPGQSEAAGGTFVTEEFAPTLQAVNNGSTAVPAVAYGFQPRIARNGRGDTGDLVNALTSQAGQTGKGDAAACVAICVTGEITHPLKADGHDGSEDGTGRGQPITPVRMMVRRLMPVECERLQGFPDHHTAAIAGPKGPKLQADGPRHKQLGNSMAVPVIRWLGERIAAELTA